ncbi:MAG: hypothetical protein M5U14_14700 [Acidimicrobiia bacterium]|nr:hypothetical protein [Acidimicrobiia bacterium]
MDKLKELTLGEKLIAGSGLVLFIASFLPWFKASFGGFSATANGWDVGFGWAGIPALLGLAAAVVVVLPKVAPDVKLPEAPWGMIMLGAGGLSALLVVLKLIMGEDFVDRSWGLFLAAIAAIGFAAGGWLVFQDEKKGSTASSA